MYLFTNTHTRAHTHTGFETAETRIRRLEM